LQRALQSCMTAGISSPITGCPCAPQRWRRAAGQRGERGSRCRGARWIVQFSVSTVQLVVEKGTPFLHRLFLAAGVPHLAKASCPELRIRFQRPPGLTRRPDQRRSNPHRPCSTYTGTFNFPATRRSGLIPTYQTASQPGHPHRQLLEQPLDYLCATETTPSPTRLLTRPAGSTENPSRWRKQELPTTTPSRSSSKPPSMLAGVYHPRANSS
jgi:hypothetical protein